VSSVLDMRSVFAETASALLGEDPLTAVVLAEISADMFAKDMARYPDRVLNVGIREQLMISVAGGLALSGMRPIVHTYAPFLVERAYEQVKLDLGHQGAGAVLVSIGGSYDAATAGRTHQAPEDVALMDSVPGMSVVVPGHPSEVASLLRSAVSGLSSGSAYLRLSSGHNAAARPVSRSLQMVRSGRRGVVVAVGPMLSPVLSAVEDLDVTVAYATTVRPRRKPSCWWSRTWRARPRSRCPRRWRRGRTGCFLWVYRVRSCVCTVRLLITRRLMGSTRPGYGAR
jgi:transketolase